jgi:O-acetyl-ADP-ribose deacetylase (regulator of RNase III)
MIEIVQGDISTMEVDAIVNAANAALRGGGGVDGAIHRAAGPALLAELEQYAGCDTGFAVRTKGYRLPARWVIHAVGPVWRSGTSEPALLRRAYESAFTRAREAGDVRSIAFPAISTGVYRFPAMRAAQIAVGTVTSEIASQPRGLQRVVFCCFSVSSAQHHQDAFGELGIA